MPERNETIARVVEPVVAALGLELYDLDLTGQGRARTLRVVIDRDGGVDLDAITAVAEAVSPVLDAEVGALAGPYALEVTSPGLERTLRTPAHFRGAVGATVSVKQRDAASASSRRTRGVLTSADDEGIELATEPDDGAGESIKYDDIVQARTVFEWGPAPKPGKGAKKKEAART